MDKHAKSGWKTTSTLRLVMMPRRCLATIGIVEEGHPFNYRLASTCYQRNWEDTSVKAFCAPNCAFTDS